MGGATPRRVGADSGYQIRRKPRSCVIVMGAALRLRHVQLVRGRSGMYARRAWTWKSAGWGRGAILGLALLTLTLAGCSLGGSTNSGSSAPGDQSLSALPWCDQPLISFQDDSQQSQQLTRWSAVKDQLGFTPYLPATLPAGSCLDLVGGTIHDPIFGGHLSVTWVLPKTGPISFSEAPKRGSVSSTPQCTQSQQGADATTICIAAVNDTSVTIASHLSASALQAYFGNLQSNVAWAPDTAATFTPTATAG